MSLLIGHNAETEARYFLEKHGLVFVEQNYHCPGGEIDLVMREGDYYVFVEVRMRQNPEHGDSLESITRSKQRRVMRSALHYLQKHFLMDQVDCRFDVVAIDKGKLSWIKNAF